MTNKGIKGRRYTQNMIKKSGIFKIINLSFCVLSLSMIFSAIAPSSIIARDPLYQKAQAKPIFLREAAHSHHDHFDLPQIDLELEGYFKSFAEYKKAKNKLESRYSLATKKILSLNNTSKEIVKNHRVKKGESVWSIAKKYSVAPSQILEHNFNIKRRPLYIGETLIIPKQVNAKKGVKFSTDKNTITHRVQKGETLYSISRKYNTGIANIQKTNNLRRKHILEIGQRLKIITNQRISTKKYDRKYVFSQWPLRGKITSQFGPRRNPLRRNQNAFHKGIDIAARIGSPIRAIKTGVVIRSRRIGGYGNCVFLLHPHNYISVYAHNKKNIVRKGAIVKEGEVVALLGRSGKATGPHLHFEIRKFKKAVDPLKLLKAKF